MYLLDTNVVSELRRPRPQPAVIAWLSSIDDSHLFICAVTIGEIQAGIELTRQQDPDKALELEAWLALVSSTYNVIPMDAGACREWARLMHRRSSTLHEDAMIAAIALTRGLTVVSRNTSDFMALGVDVLNPFSEARPGERRKRSRPR